MGAIQKKICMVGAYGVGKTSLVRRFVESLFDERYLSTVGVTIDKKVVTAAGGREVALIIWDLAGEDDRRRLRLSHLRGAAGFLLVMDGTRRRTLSLAIDLAARVGQALGPLPFVALVNKRDLAGEWEVSSADLDDLAARGWRLLLTSAKTGEGVEAAFSQLAAGLLAGGAPE